MNLTIDPVFPGPDTRISNSISVDKYGGIYAVTATTMNRVQWNSAVRLYICV